MQPETKQCQNCKNEFIIEPDDFAFYEKIKVPAPTFCPECRMVRRFTWRNERALYKDTCDLCNRSTVSLFAPDQPFTVYCNDCYLSDKWDPINYGVEFDEKTPFFVQYRKLLERVPLPATFMYPGAANVSYSNFVGDAKDVYFSNSIFFGSERVMYSRSIDRSKDIIDCLNINESELLYETTDSFKNYRCAYTFQSHGCMNSSFLFDCANCQNCFMSSNLRNKSYMIRNKQYTKEDYEKQMQSIDFGSYSQTQKLREEFSQMKENALHKFANITKGEYCTGNDIENAKEAVYCFNIYDAQQVKFCSRAAGARNCYDAFGVAGELMYEGVGTGFGGYANQFYAHTNALSNSLFAYRCYNSSNLFGCTSLTNKQYCVLNKQYTKESFEALVLKIIQQMKDMPYIDKKGRIYKHGEFFPTELSPYAYNETIAQEYFPLTKEQALEKGYRWKDPETRNYQIDIYSDKLPDHINDVDESIIGKVIECAHKGTCNEQCTTAFKVVQGELEFYKKMGFPVPRLCPNCRHYDRLKQKNPFKLWHRQCMCDKNHPQHSGKCPNEFETSYAPDRPEIVYCEQCYQAEVV